MAFTDKRKEICFCMEGDWVILTEEMFEGMSQKEIQNIIRVYEMYAKRQKRESRCRKLNGARCMGRCNQCDKKRNGRPLSLEELKENGYEHNSSINLEEQVIRNECYQELHNIINELDEIEKQIIILYFLENKTEREITDIIGFKQKRVNCRKHKIFEKMKERLQDFV